jgi:hypothetical protein
MKQKSINSVLPLVFILLLAGVGALFIWNDRQKAIPVSDPSIINRSSQPAFSKITPNGGYNWVMEKKNVVVKTEDEWNALLKSGSGGPSKPDVDFSKEMIIVVFSGPKMSGGYGVGVINVAEEENVIKVFVRHTAPGENCTVTLAGTYPYQMIQLSKSDKAVEFVEEQVVKDCAQ